MLYDEFVDRVKDSTRIETREMTAAVITATLETFGERISRTHRHHLAAQLPAELKKSLLHDRPADQFPMVEFYNKVSARTKRAYPHVVIESRAVMLVLQEAVSTGELRDIMAAFPGEYDELLGKHPESPLSPTSLTATQEEHLRKTEHGQTRWE